MRINTAPRRQNAGRPPEKSAPAFLQWLRGRCCAVPGCDRPFKMEAAHVDGAGDKGMGTKVSDRYAVPMCGGPEGHHAEQHRVGWATFQHRHNFNAISAALAFWRAWPGRTKWETLHG